MTDGTNQRIVSREDFRAKVADIAMATDKPYAAVEKEVRAAMHIQGQVVEGEENLDFSAGNPAEARN